MRLRLALGAIAACLSPFTLLSQGQFSGDLQLETQFYVRDTTIGASGTEHYDVLKNGGDAWLSLNYLNNDWDLSIGARFDAHYNSNLHNPGTAFSGLGLGTFYIQKGVGNLDITGGFLYDQFGSGLTFRAYEERTLGIDKALIGVRLRYDLGESWTLTGLAGKQKDLFGSFAPIMLGAEIEGSVQVGEKLFLGPGASVVNRSMDAESMDQWRADLLVSGQLQPGDSVLPLRNATAASIFNTLDFGRFNWYVEFAGRNHSIDDLNTDEPFDQWGNAFYTSLTYSTKGLGITGQYRRVDNFELRTSPNEQLLQGIFNYLPTLTRQNSLRLPARYSAVARDLDEVTYEFDLVYTPVKGYTISANYSDVRELDGDELFREAYADVEIRKSRDWKLLLGGQFVQYNQEEYEAKPGAKLVESVTPFVEFLYKIDRKKSLRLELQYMHMLDEADLGSWAYALIEFNMAPSLSISASDMYNIDPTDKSPGKIHYYTFYTSYTHKANRFYVSYSKQVEGVVCTGGVCRFEPAFSGLKFGVQSSF